MLMRNTILFIVFLIVVFLVNLVFYYISEDYQFFLKKLKNPNEVVYIDEKNINDDFTPILPEWTTSIKTNTNNQEIFKENIENNIELKNEVNLGKNYLDIIRLFWIYDLKLLELNTNLFDLTDEYPDPYYEYYSKDLTLYLFTTKSYNDVKDIINIISYDVPYKINEVNNFLDKSFYINLDEKISDNFVRLVISYKSITFWLKIKKDVYNDVKETLKQIDSTTEITEEEVK